MSEKDEIQINFRDYILYTLKRWRSIIAVALVFALIAAGLVVFKSLNSWDENLSKYDAELVTYNEEKEAYDTNFRVVRGASSIYMSTVSPAADRDGIKPTSNHNDRSTRAVLYINL